MKITLSRKGLFPEDVETLLSSISSAGFFSHGLLAGSWTFPVYCEAFNVKYVLKTFDIDLAVDAVSSKVGDYMDLEKILTELDYIPVMNYSTGLQKFTKEGFEIEFLIHRKGGREKDKELIRQYNITAMPLPFIDMLFCLPMTVDLGGYEIRLPSPETMFIHKLVIAQRRKSPAKRENDLSQCQTLIQALDYERLVQTMSSLRLSNKTRKLILTSCQYIDFPPQLMGI